MVQPNAPGVPTFYPGPLGDMAAQLNSGWFTPAGQVGGIRDTMDFMLNRPKFRARRVASQTIATGHQYVVWDTIDADNYGGGSAGSSIYTVKVAGWYMVSAKVSLSTTATATAGQALIPACAVNGSSPTGLGSNGWEGQEIGVALASGAPKCVPGLWQIYGNVNDQIQIDLWFSSESGITATGTTAGFTPSVSLVWSSK